MPTKLRLLVILRHGPYGPGDFLTESGRNLIGRVGEFLKTRYDITENECAIVCSGKLRAIKTAQRLANVLGIDHAPECRDEFFSDCRTCNVAAALATIDEFGAKYPVVIVVSHLEMVDQLPSAFAEKASCAKADGARNPDYGEGVVIDMSHRTSTRLTV